MERKKFRGEHSETQVPQFKSSVTSGIQKWLQKTCYSLNIKLLKYKISPFYDNFPWKVEEIKNLLSFEKNSAPLA